MMTLFDHAREKKIREEQPLAARMRPRTLDEYIGQEHILAPGRLLRRAIQIDQLSSLIFYGPPGTGKTTLASVIANTTKSCFVTLNAVMAGIADLREITQAAQRRLGEYSQRTTLFIDEVHRWNKAQQDALLPWVENGTIVLIGATTENPYFTVNRALVSRSRIFQLKPLEANDIVRIIQQAAGDKERGYGNLNIAIDDDAMMHFANVANGDARAALNAVELAIETTQPDSEGLVRITLPVAEESIQHRAVLYDREGDYHFDTISAFIKSMRGSDVDATFYWLAKMVYAGEDPRFIFRRMTIFASEDIGMADPNAVQFVMSCADAFDRVGLPEGHYPLAHAALYCATAPKSNSVLGFFDALKLVEQEREGEVPNHLRDASRDKNSFGHGVGYKYPHSYQEHWVAQQYLPSSLQGRIFYEPGEIGYEKQLASLVRSRRELQLAVLRENEEACAPPEVLTFSPKDRKSEQWLARAVESMGGQYAMLRENIFRHRTLQRNDRILNLAADSGMLLWEAVRAVPEGGVMAVVSSENSRTCLLEQAFNVPELRRPEIRVGSVMKLDSLLGTDNGNSACLYENFEFIIGRNVISPLPREDWQEAFRQIAGAASMGGTVCLAENIPQYSQRLCALLLEAKTEIAGQSWFQRLTDAENAVYGDSENIKINWNEFTLVHAAEAAGLPATSVSLFDLKREIILAPALIERWFNGRNEECFARLLEKNGAGSEDISQLYHVLASELIGRPLHWKTVTAVFCFEQGKKS